MFIRIVKMHFEENKIEDFLANFHKHKNDIRNFEGCRFLELYQDKDNKCIFFTYSFWENKDDLERYRQSDLFKNVWKTTKAWFAGKPQAWSVDKIVSLP